MAQDKLRIFSLTFVCFQLTLLRSGGTYPDCGSPSMGVGYGLVEGGRYSYMCSGDNSQSNVRWILVRPTGERSYYKPCTDYDTSQCGGEIHAEINETESHFDSWLVFENMAPRYSHWQVQCVLSFIKSGRQEVVCVSRVGEVQRQPQSGCSMEILGYGGVNLTCWVLQSIKECRVKYKNNNWINNAETKNVIGFVYRNISLLNSTCNTVLKNLTVGIQSIYAEIITLQFNITHNKTFEVMPPLYISLNVMQRNCTDRNDSFSVVMVCKTHGFKTKPDLVWFLNGDMVKEGKYDVKQNDGLADVTSAFKFFIDRTKGNTMAEVKCLVGKNSIEESMRVSVPASPKYRNARNSVINDVLNLMYGEVTTVTCMGDNPTITTLQVICWSSDALILSSSSGFSSIAVPVNGSLIFNGSTCTCSAGYASMCVYLNTTLTIMVSADRVSGTTMTSSSVSMDASFVTVATVLGIVLINVILVLIFSLVVRRLTKYSRGRVQVHVSSSSHIYETVDDLDRMTTREVVFTPACAMRESSARRGRSDVDESGYLVPRVPSRSSRVPHGSLTDPNSSLTPNTFFNQRPPLDYSFKESAQAGWSKDSIPLSVRSDFSKDDVYITPLSVVTDSSSDGKQTWGFAKGRKYDPGSDGSSDEVTVRTSDWPQQIEF
ncbi:uncharacterized protein LOC131942228 [Physella acuta]|uniref:uncharacterized protein LOC131942228 n=1 Tax=Physella acuta TaxID=109671 RepID=UPI0027DD7D8D|nr:uncharacterized protein LOC131942228 [Physella acuta]XP_059157967.1 uncharacterized protein LOC131942228 [Physella acuta]